MGEIHHTVWGWIIGFGLVSCFLGGLVSYEVWLCLHKYFDHLMKTKHWKMSSDLTTTIKYFPVVIGILERILFTLLIAFQVGGVAGGLIAWIAVKLAVGWGAVKDGKTPNRALAFVGLLSNLTSLLFAVLGGLIANGNIPIYKWFSGWPA